MNWQPSSDLKGRVVLVGIDASRAVTSEPTGTEIYSLCLIQEMLRLSASHDFRLYTRSRPSNGVFPDARVRVIPFPRMWTHLRLSWEMFRFPPDVLFVPAHVLPLIRPRRTVVTVHDLGYVKFPEAHPVRQRAYLALSTWWNVRVASHVVADSKATRADIITRYRVDPGKVTVVYPGVNEALNPVKDREQIEVAKTRYGIDGRYFLYLGRLQPRKNLSALVTSFNELLPELASDFRLVLAGKVGWMTETLFSQITGLGLENRVILPGYVADTDKAALLSGAEAFLFPSLYEGFGLPVLEAQSCGCPVMTSTTSSLPEVAGDSALLVDPADGRAITGAMRRLATDSELRRALSAAGQRNVCRFSWASSAQELLRIIGDLME